MQPAARALALAGTAALLSGSPGVARGDSTSLDDPTLIALALTLATSPAPDAGDAQPVDAAAGERAPQVELVTTVRARSIRFSALPRVHVNFSGSGPRRTHWRIERVNLPARVQPGVVYRDVTVKLTLTSTVEDFAVLLRDARSASRELRIEAEPSPSSGAIVPASTRSAAPSPSPPAVP